MDPSQTEICQGNTIFGQMPVFDLCGYVNIVNGYFYANKFHIIWSISTGISTRNQNLRCQSVRHSDPGVFNSAASQLQICDYQDHLDLERFGEHGCLKAIGSEVCATG